MFDLELAIIIGVFYRGGYWVVSAVIFLFAALVLLESSKRCRL